MSVKGIMGSIDFDGEWVTITKKPAGQRSQAIRLRAADITGTRFKEGSRLFNGYVQFLLPGSLASDPKTRGLAAGRPPQSDPHSLSIRRKANEAARELVAAVEQARLNP